MRLFRTSLIALSTLMMSCSSQSNKNNWNLQWSEEFNQSTLDTSMWSKIPRGGSDWNRHMSSLDTLFELREGKLILRGIYNTDRTRDTARFLTGGVYTKNKKAFDLGRLEIRAKLGNAQGAWPAFWMLPEGKSWPNGGEIDIMEHLSYDQKVYQTVHSHYTYTLKINTPPHSDTTTIKMNEFNTYAVERYQDSLVFYVNDQRTFAYPRIKTDKKGQFPYADTPFYLLLDMQLGGSWVGQVNPEDLPVEMAIDWVRFYTPAKK